MEIHTHNKIANILSKQINYKSVQRIKLTSFKMIFTLILILTFKRNQILGKSNFTYLR